MNEQLTKRRTIRLMNYDYSQEGLYSVTVCCQDKICRFGEVGNGVMVLNGAGKIAHDEWLRTLQLRTNIELGEFIIMPNHMHGIIIIKSKDVGANCIRPNDENVYNTGVCNTPLQEKINELSSPSQTLGTLIRGYKASVTKKIRQLYNIENLSIWQRNYYEHIIRNEESHHKITDYIINNPYNWENDNYYKN